MTQNIVLVSDFDGTITDDDFFTYTTRAYFDEKALTPWREYLDGKKTHFNALKEMFAQIRVDEDSLEDLISTIKIDDKVHKVFDLCKGRGIEIYVCSAGNDYYINKMIGADIKKYNITLVTNQGEYSKDKGLQMHSPRKDSKYYDEKIGISKYKLVKYLKDEGKYVIFAGDGPPDFEPAEIADVVFARKMLLDKCRQAGIATMKFDGFEDIYQFILHISEEQ